MMLYFFGVSGVSEVCKDVQKVNTITSSDGVSAVMYEVGDVKRFEAMIRSSSFESKKSLAMMRERDK